MEPIAWRLFATRITVVGFLPEPKLEVFSGQGQIATFGVAALAKPAATYQWRKYVGGVATDISGPTVASLAIGAAVAGEVTFYDVVISNVMAGLVNTVTSPVRVLTVLPDFHSADINRDRRISVAEVTRVIQLYNHRSGSTRTGEYHV